MIPMMTRARGIKGFHMYSTDAYSGAADHKIHATWDVDDCYVETSPGNDSRTFHRLIDTGMGVGFVGLHAMQMAYDCDKIVKSTLADAVGLVDTATRGSDMRMHGDCVLPVAIAKAMLMYKNRTHRRALVLGAGPLGKAAIIACQSLGLYVIVSDKSKPLSRATAAATGCEHRRHETLGSASFDVLVNATTDGEEFGAHPNRNPWTFVNLNRPGGLERCRLVVDMSYNRKGTKLVNRALLQGCRVVDGAEISVNRCAERSEAWHGQCPEDDMIAVAENIVSAERRSEARA